MLGTHYNGTKVITTQYNDIRYNDTQCNDTQYYDKAKMLVRIAKGTSF